jgi:hypothetical protein
LRLDHVCKISFNTIIGREKVEIHLEIHSKFPERDSGRQEPEEISSKDV